MRVTGIYFIFFLYIIQDILEPVDLRAQMTGDEILPYRRHSLRNHFSPPFIFN
jgi:hypothetical protein